MEATAGMRAFKELFAFPFRDANWMNKFLIASGLAIAATFIPILPIVPLYGYMAQVMRDTINGDGQLRMPEWDDWGKLFMDGLRVGGVVFLMMLPALLIMLLGIVLYLFSFFGIIFTSNSPSGSPAAIFAMLMVFAPFFMIFTQLISSLLAIVALFFVPAAMAHVSATGRFMSFFGFGWRWVLRANFGGFMVALFILAGMLAVMYVGFLMLYMTMVLCWAIPLVLAPVSFYMMLILGAVSAQAYREGREIIAAAGTVGQPGEALLG